MLEPPSPLELFKAFHQLSHPIYDRLLELLSGSFRQLARRPLLDVSNHASCAFEEFLAIRQSAPILDLGIHIGKLFRQLCPVVLEFRADLHFNWTLVDVKNEMDSSVAKFRVGAPIVDATRCKLSQGFLKVGNGHILRLNVVDNNRQARDILHAGETRLLAAQLRNDRRGRLAKSPARLVSPLLGGCKHQLERWPE